MQVTTLTTVLVTSKDKKIDPIDFALIVHQAMVLPQRDELPDIRIVKFERQGWNNLVAATVEWHGEEDLPDADVQEPERTA